MEPGPLSSAHTPSSSSPRGPVPAGVGGLRTPVPGAPAGALDHQHAVVHQLPQMTVRGLTRHPESAGHVSGLERRAPVQQFEDLTFPLDHWQNRNILFPNRKAGDIRP